VRYTETRDVHPIRSHSKRKPEPSLRQPFRQARPTAHPAIPLAPRQPVPLMPQSEAGDRRVPGPAMPGLWFRRGRRTDL